jgi:putative DNA primase/helicase
LFAEAIRRYRAGEPWWPTPAFEAEVIVPEQELRREVDAWEAKILTWLADGMPGLPAQSEPRVRVWEVALFALGLEAPRLGRAEQNRITTALDRAGWGRAPRTGAGCWWAPKVSE